MKETYQPLFCHSDNPEAEIIVPLLNPLFKDMVCCEKLMMQSPDAFSRRTYVRSCFALIEGHLYFLKGLVAQLLLKNGIKNLHIEAAKFLLLGDFSYRVSKTGTIESEPNRIPFLNYCALIFRTYAECAGLNAEPLFSGIGWQSMQSALKIRHRITHPKSPHDLDISAVEVELCKTATRWIYETWTMIQKDGFKIESSESPSVPLG